MTVEVQKDIYCLSLRKTFTTTTDTVEIINFDCPEFQFLLHLCGVAIQNFIYTYLLQVEC